MVELYEQEIITLDRNSSKGNQLKWKNGDIWYKADYTGYEGLTEYMVSNLLAKSSLDMGLLVRYELEQISYKHIIMNGVKSQNFMKDEWQIITLERLFKNQYGKSMYESVWKIRSVTDRFEFLEEETARITGITGFKKYLAILFTIDAFFLNEDRHLHNIAVLMNKSGDFRLCPIFDSGASLLSDTSVDYPLSVDVYSLLGVVKSKTISHDFDEQLDVAEKLCGEQLHFYFDKKDVERLLQNAGNFYEKEVIERIRVIIYQQMAKYSYLFK